MEYYIKTLCQQVRQLRRNRKKNPKTSNQDGKVVNS